MKAEDILKLINPEDNSNLAKAAREDLQNGGPRLLALKIQDGYVTELQVQPANDNTAPFRIENDSYDWHASGFVTHTTKIRRARITDKDFTLRCCWMCKHCVLDIGRGYICKTDNHLIGGNMEVHLNQDFCSHYSRN